MDSPVVSYTLKKSDQIPQLHERVAERMYDLFTSNGGLYIKIGQAIGANAALLPKPMQIKFAKLFDDAPQIPYSDVEKVFKAEFGRPPDGPDGVFEVFEKDACASASIAQVHKAKLWSAEGDREDRWVAVKIQKPDVGVQMEWDLAAYRAVMWMFEHWAFDLPVYFVVDIVSDHLRQELDFVREANNAKKTAGFVQAEPSLRDKVYIPEVYPEFSTKRVMTAEWIEGVRLSDQAAVRAFMGKSESRPSVFGSFLTLHRGREGGISDIMKTMVELFSAQMFSWGWVHCDPHPGNIIIRPHPKNPRRPQLVLIDHGLYIGINEDFRREWVELWRGMLTNDYVEVERVTKSWGIGLPDLFASVTLMKPMRLRRTETRDEKKRRIERDAKLAKITQYEASLMMKQKLKEFLIDTDRMPKALIFLMRNMRMVQGNNQSFGSPVNRVKIMGYWASSSLPRNSNMRFREQLREYWHHLVFLSVMLSLDIAFWQTKISLWIRRKLRLDPGLDFEDQLEKSMRGFAKSTFGMDLGPAAFAG